MLKYRVLAALCLIPLVLAMLFWLPLSYFMLVAIVVVALAAWEWSQFVPMRQTFLRVCYAACFSAMAALWAIALCLWSNNSTSNFSHINLVFLTLCIAAIWWGIALLLVLFYPKSAKYWSQSGLLKTLAGVLTIIPFFVALVTLRQQLYFDDRFVGSWTILYIFILIWSTDTGAYFAGRLLGKHKLAPHVSPGKTWEGLLGGVISAGIAGFIFLHWIGLPFDSLPLFMTSTLTVFVSILGDLTESMFKREAKIKDSGALIPGHGGILDRIDSLLAALPIFALFALYLLKTV